MKKAIGKVNQFEEVSFLEIFYNENNKVIKFNYNKKKLLNDVNLSELEENSITTDRTTFEFLKNILRNLRRKNEN